MLESHPLTRRNQDKHCPFQIGLLPNVRLVPHFVKNNIYSSEWRGYKGCRVQFVLRTPNDYLRSETSIDDDTALLDIDCKLEGPCHWTSLIFYHRLALDCLLHDFLFPLSHAWLTNTLQLNSFAFKYILHPSLYCSYWYIQILHTEGLTRLWGELRCHNTPRWFRWSTYVLTANDQLVEISQWMRHVFLTSDEAGTRVTLRRLLGDKDWDSRMTFLRRPRPQTPFIWDGVEIIDSEPSRQPDSVSFLFLDWPLNADSERTPHLTSVGLLLE